MANTGFALIAAVCDGVGSQRNSDLGSQTASAACVAYCAKFLQSGMSDKDVLDIAKEAFGFALQSVYDMSAKNLMDFGQCDTTMTLGIIIDGDLFYGHVGDSGMFALFTDGRILQVTDPQNDEEGRVFPLRDASRWAFGKALGKAAAALLCTDGVWSMLHPKRPPGAKIKYSIPLIDYYIDPGFLDRRCPDGNVESLLGWIDSELDLINKEHAIEARYDDLTIVVMQDTSQAISYQPDAYYMVPDPEDQSSRSAAPMAETALAGPPPSALAAQAFQQSQYPGPGPQFPAQQTAQYGPVQQPQYTPPYGPAPLGPVAQPLGPVAQPFYSGLPNQQQPAPIQYSGVPQQPPAPTMPAPPASSFPTLSLQLPNTPVQGPQSDAVTASNVFPDLASPSGQLSGITTLPTIMSQPSMSTQFSAPQEQLPSMHQQPLQPSSLHSMTAQAPGIATPLPGMDTSYPSNNQMPGLGVQLPTTPTLPPPVATLKSGAPGTQPTSPRASQSPASAPQAIKLDTLLNYDPDYKYSIKDRVTLAIQLFKLMRRNGNRMPGEIWVQDKSFYLANSETYAPEFSMHIAAQYAYRLLANGAKYKRPQKEFVYHDDTPPPIESEDDPPAAIISDKLRNYFDIIFRVAEGSVSTDDWINALETYETTLFDCPFNRKHSYNKHSFEQCPWCKYDNVKKLMLAASAAAKSEPKPGFFRPVSEIRPM
jgi:hypothetical protein